ITTYQGCLWLRPSVESAVSAGVLGLADRLLSPGLGGFVVSGTVVIEDRGFGRQVSGASSLKTPALLDVVRHVLASLFPPRLTGVGRDQAHLAHFRCPFLVVIGPSRRLAAVVLP